MNILVIGGSGFVGHAVCNKLVAADHTVVVPTRKRDKARDLFMLPTLTVLEADVTDPATLASLVHGQDAVINAVGILNENRRGDFERIHVTLTANIIAACRAANVNRYLHLSALGAAVDAPSEYLRSKARAEALVTASGLDYTIVAPSVIFGVGDRFLNRFAQLAGLLPPWMPLAVPSVDTRFQPIWVNDVARVIEQALLGVQREMTWGQRYELVGPKIYTLRELVRQVLTLTGTHHVVLGLPDFMALMLAGLLQYVPTQPLTPDNLKSMSIDSVSTASFPAIAGVATALEDVVPTYIGTAALTDEFATARQHVPSQRAQ